MTPEICSLQREIDRVTVKGSNQPIRLYTVDMDTENLEPKVGKFIYFYT